jgi:hypothetical protein
MQIGEAKISALAVSALTGVGLTLMLNQALRDLGYALTISVPVTLVMGGVLFLSLTTTSRRAQRAAARQSYQRQLT